jgi:hypothetical protein
MLAQKERFHACLAAHGLVLLPIDARIVVRRRSK